MHAVPKDDALNTLATGQFQLTVIDSLESDTADSCSRDEQEDGDGDTV
jgi:hypothetical protein